MSDYYDRAGQPLDMWGWAHLFEDRDYQRVAETQVGVYWVSTVWLGLNHNYYDDGPPLIFETMVFAPDGDDDSIHHLGPDIDTHRYSTEAAALTGHEEVCLLIRATIQTNLEGSNDEATTDRG